MQKLFKHINILDHDKYTLPYCNCLLIEDDITCLVDSSPHPKQRPYLEDKRIDLIVNSHGHSDHNSCNYLYPEAKVLLHPAEHERVALGEAYLTAYGYYFYPDEATRHFYLDAVQYHVRPADGDLSDGQKISTGVIEFEVLALPGHSIGHCGFFFPRQGFIFTADINLRIKPIYAMLDSSVDDYIDSLERLREIKADMLVGGHGPALYTEDLDRRLLQYRDEILYR
ncbi:MAG: MBL fold metallo-hydrolase, partial [Deltaproteobacteria bacterium]